ncbi:DUF2303 family protein [Siculibacillus lacustris]|uniref:DUF2303 family protein n=1 Tax=Siculibacillus lacustris TaxID=1549641 RepID=A0A4Q9VS76_9HYPH|nr:DUF2303 family protein [Siculibacillus lacustris]TBW38802.1 DUF2303 family protein [Siculibacillus lacustris]
MEPQTITAEAIREVTALADKSRKIEIIEISNVAGTVGVPEKIAVGIKTGERPEIVGLETFFESYREHPKAKRGAAKALTLASFVDLTRRHMTESSAIFASTDWRRPALLTVIDYHAPNDESTIGTPGWLRHRIEYGYPISDDWKIWVEGDGKAVAQGDFAAFIEDRIADLAAPSDAERTELEQVFETKMATPNELIRLSRGLQVNVESKIKNVVSLQTGAAQIAFEETHQDSDGKPLTVPGLFLLQIAPFASGDRIRLPVRLRYRAQGGKLVWFYQIYRPDQYITARLREDITHVAEATALPIFEGTPEAA